MTNRNRGGRRWLCLLTTLCLIPLLTGCGRESNIAPAATLPPAESLTRAPAGWDGLKEARRFTMYLPGKDGMRLVARDEELETDRRVHSAETVARALLSLEGDENTRELGGGVSLQLFGERPVEVSGGVCTLNLGSSALQPERERFYEACQALTSTLCALDDISHVNVLVAGQAVSMDISGNLFMGSLTAQPGAELPVLWEQMKARQVEIGEDPGLEPVSGVATLYFPLRGGERIMPETRTLTFDGQTPRQLAAGLLKALSAGSVFLKDASPMPDLNSLLLYHPLVSEMEDGGRLVTLIFADDLEERPEVKELGFGNLMAAVTWTLTTFIPGVAAVNFRLGESLVMSLQTEEHGTIFFQGGIQRREQFRDFLAEQVTVYFSGGELLLPVTRTVNEGENRDPKRLLKALMEGPTEEEKALGLDKVMPEGLTEEEILGIGIEGDTLLVNLSGNCRERFSREAGEYEQMLCYSMVNTLCERMGTRRVRFFFDGEMAESLGGSIYWGGEFLYNPALIDRSIG